MFENTFTLTCDCGCEVMKISGAGKIEVDVRGAVSIQCRECHESKIYVIGSGRVTDEKGVVSIIV